MKVLVVGNGGREHALVWKLAQSSRVSKLYCAPGNAGISKLAECITIKSFDTNNLIDFVRKYKIDLTIVGPELPLVNGIVDDFDKLGLRIFGPEAKAAKLEGSKVFAKKMMKTLNIPTSDFLIFNDATKAKKIIKFVDQPLVIKADGLAAGKGVFICEGKDEGIEAINKIMIQKKFGESGQSIVIEKKLQGLEASFMAFTDGISIAPMPVIVDNKKLLAKDKGPNTGGMGATGPIKLNEKEYDIILNKIAKPLLKKLLNQGIVYKGILYIGLIRDSFNYIPKVLEFNVRFGDPECQILMMLLETDLIDIIEAIEKQELNKINIKWKDNYVKTVALVSGGYPNKYQVGYEIDGLDKEYLNKKFPNTYIFHGGTKFSGDKIVTNGGRVLYITSTGKNVHKDTKLVIDNINFKSKYYREDI